MSHKKLSADTLSTLKLGELKSECKDRGLHITGTKPVLIGRILDFQETGDAKQSNKRDIEDLKGIAEQAPSKKNKSISIHAQKLIKNHSKNAFVQQCKDITREFNKLWEKYGISGPHLDLNGDCLKVEYDELTLEKFIEDMKEKSKGLVSWNLSSHKYLGKEIFEKVQFPVLQALSADNAPDMNDEDLSMLLSACPSLKVLDLLYSFVIGDGFKDIDVKCPDLQWIKISPRNLKVAISYIHKCKMLDTLEVVPSHLVFDDEDIEKLVAMPKLKNCTIQFNKGITQKGIELLCQKPTFTLEDFPTGDMMAFLSPSTAEFKPDTTIKLEEFQEAISKMPQLKTLSFCKFNNNSTCDINAALECVSNSPCAATLEIVDLSMQADINDKGVEALGKMKSIKDLGLGLAWGDGDYQSKNFSEEVFVQASKSWKNLEILDIMFSPISIENMEQVVLNCPKLKKVDMTGCAGGDDFSTFGFAMQDSKILSRVRIIHKRRVD